MRCPYCKREASHPYLGTRIAAEVLGVTLEDDPDGDYWRVYCPKCGALGPRAQTEPNAIRKWRRGALLSKVT